MAAKQNKVTKKAGGFLTKKVGPLPMWAWVVTAIGTYLAYRYFAGSSASLTTPAAADNSGTTGTPTDTSGLGGGSVTGSSPDTSGYQAYSDLVANLESQNADLLSAVLSSNANYSTGGNVTGNGDGSSSGTGSGGTTSSTVSPYIVSAGQKTIPATTRNFAQAAVAKTAAGAAAGTKVAFGGVTSVTKLKNGGTVTTYASGRKVEQVPGKSAYVIHQ